MKPFLILQLRPEAEASDDEFAAICAKGGLAEADTRRVRLDCEELGTVRLDDYSGVIVGGGPGCVSDPPEEKSPVEAKIEAAVLGLMPEITARDFPFLGCCYGIGILGKALGGPVGKGRFGEPVGTSACRVVEGDPLLEGVAERFDAFVGHKEAMEALPGGCVQLVESGPCPFQMVRFRQNVYATQFHPEADAAGFETRIRIYRHKGYFDPGEADGLIAMCRAAEVTEPEKILRNFVARFG
ncbi:glutamine amidotransferase [Vannielia litorea]|uniref:glutamine amidotransferase n=1 Tax=Vannielia litorea TaxID=1217970 RepID=UPI001BD0D96F|nr:glutamine amidotransferase [Vannielia litorea]MBS8227741.1 glutamine amidotransferase [Vannielia litorea]